jgi:ERCC4-type nuclease
LLGKWETRSNAFFDGTTASQSGSLRGNSTSLQGLSGVGPALAQRLLIKFGSVERVVTADEATLTQVSGIGSRKAARIRELVAG